MTLKTLNFDRAATEPVDHKPLPSGQGQLTPDDMTKGDLPPQQVSESTDAAITTTEHPLSDTQEPDQIPPPSGDVAQNHLDSIPATELRPDNDPDPDNPPPNNGGEAKPPPDIGDQQQGPPSFISFAKSYSVELFHTMQKIGYVTLQDKEVHKTMSIRSKEFKLLLLCNYYLQSGALPHKSEEKEALEMLEAEALFKSPERKVYVRHAKVNGVIFIDLGGPDYKQVKITRKGWRIIDANNSPVKFIRPIRMRPMVTPLLGGSLEQLKDYVNVKDPYEFALIIAWVVAAMNPDGPYPILVLMGEQGSGKSSLSRTFVDLVDPTYPATTSPPRSERDLMISAVKKLVMCYDNMSSIPPWLADAFCRLATGGGFVTRTLRTDDLESIFEGKKPIIVNGISGLLERHDLADRSIVIVLDPISKANRRLESDIQKSWKTDKAKILGAIFTALSAALRNIDMVELPEYPRMADFAQWVTAAAFDGALPFTSELFLKAYSDNRMNLVDDALYADPVGWAVQRCVEKGGEWSGTPTQLLSTLSQITPVNLQRQKAWPKQANVLSGKLRRCATFLREKNIEVEFSKSGKRNISIRLVADDADAMDISVRKADAELLPSNIPATQTEYSKSDTTQEAA